MSANEKKPSRERLSDIARSLPEGELVRRVRELEQKDTQQSAELRATKLKLDQAETDLKEALDREEVLLAVEGQVKAKKIKQGTRKREPCTAIITANDWHTEANIDPAVVNDLNKFDLDIAVKRLTRLWERSLYLIELWRTVADIRHVTLWAGGDLVNGYIHPELEEGNFLGPAEAILYVENQLATGIDTLKGHKGIERVDVLTSYGNHGRATQKKRIATGYKTSWEWLAYSHLAKIYAPDPKVEFHVAQGYHNYFDIQGHTWRFHHGDSIRYQGGVGGITIPVNKAIAQWNKSRHADYDVFGHWHQYMDCWGWTACGCLCGYDAYALSIKADFQPPTQTFIPCSKKHGKDVAIPIFLE